MRGLVQAFCDLSRDRSEEMSDVSDDNLSGRSQCGDDTESLESSDDEVTSDASEEPQGPSCWAGFQDMAHRVLGQGEGLTFVQNCSAAGHRSTLNVEHCSTMHCER